jgi:phenylacetic acid degradation protein paaN
MTLYAKHADILEQARQACLQRHSWSPYPEMPSKYPQAEQAQAQGEQAFRSHLGSTAERRRFQLEQPGTQGWIGEEISPYTQEALQIEYPQADTEALFEAAGKAMHSWSQASIEDRLGALMEVIEVIYREHLFEITHAVMHTAGQSYNMAYTGSGVNALDRGIEALVYAEQAMRAVSPSARWERPFGPAQIRLEKTYRLIPRGVAVCFTCASFPTWNAWPSMMASLATGNAVIVKPHPATVLPMAISIRVFRRVLAAAGFDPNLVTMALDSPSEPIGKRLVQHPRTALVDFTGSLVSGWRKTPTRRWPSQKRPATTPSSSIRWKTSRRCCAAWPPHCACSARRCAPARKTSTCLVKACARRRAGCPWKKWGSAWPGLWRNSPRNPRGPP